MGRWFTGCCSIVLAIAVISASCGTGFALVQPRGTDATCVPLYSNCTCQTPRNLTAAEIDLMSNIIAGNIHVLQTNSTYQKQDPVAATFESGKFIGAIVRLAFHDAVEYDMSANDGFRADGCLDTSNPGHAGLEDIVAKLDTLWYPFCNRISRADYWQLAGKVAIEESCPYVEYKRGGSTVQYVGAQPGFTPTRKLFAGQANRDHFVLPWRLGRIDRQNCTTGNRSRVPSAEAGISSVELYLMRNFNLTAAQAVALMGAHALGRATPSFSGYNGSWKDTSDVFTITYFKLLLINSWTRANMTEPVTQNRIFQWNIVPRGNSDLNAMMLNTDMALVYDVANGPGGAGVGPSTCGPALSDKISPAFSTPLISSSTCPLMPSIRPDLNFSWYVQLYAEGETASRDEPGASRWLAQFPAAWQAMAEAGYPEGSLWCPNAIPSFCQNCTLVELCYMKASARPEGYPNGSWPSVLPMPTTTSTTTPANKVTLTSTKASGPTISATTPRPPSSTLPIKKTVALTAAPTKHPTRTASPTKHPTRTASPTKRPTPKVTTKKR